MTETSTEPDVAIDAPGIKSVERILAHEGEIVTCENGHDVCTVAEKLVSWSRISVSSFKDFKMPVAGPNDEVLKCECGAEFIRSHPGFRLVSAVEIHFSDGWR